MSPPQFATGLVWFRRDLRAHDHAALSAALQQCQRVFGVFVFDTDILEPLPRADRRVEFIRDAVAALDADLRALAKRNGVGLCVAHGSARTELPRLAQRLHAQAVFTHRDGEPAAVARDTQVRGALANAGVAFFLHRDQMVFEPGEVLTQSRTPYTVFTPYKAAWLRRYELHPSQPHEVAAHAQALAELPLDLQTGVPTLADLDFQPTNLHELGLGTGTAGARALLDDFLAKRLWRYHLTRDFPAVRGPSYLGVHLRFGTLSIGELVRLAWAQAQGGHEGAQTWLSELIWREFYMTILADHPTVVDHAFRKAFDAIHWERGAHAKAAFAAWCEGRTGYPLVDAAMAQLNRTGYMHNRLRMVTASFLVKDLGIDWRWGERYFALHLNDYDQSANNGGWQWAASTGCDAQPWFRIFNPVRQSEKFDPEGKFIRRYLPQLAGLPTAALHQPWLASPIELAAAGVELGRDYPLPIVDHAQAKARTLERFGVVKAAE